MSTILGAIHPQSVAIKTEISNQLKRVVWPLIKEKKIKPLIYETFSMEDAPKAHELMKSSQHIGKIVLEMQT